MNDAHLSRYPGIRPFQPEEYPLFFGRDKEIADLRRLLQEEQTVVLFGHSGTGKSSLIQAGLAPALLREHWAASIVRFGPYQAGRADTTDLLLDRLLQQLNDFAQDVNTPAWFNQLPRDVHSPWYPLKKMQMNQNLPAIVLIFDQAEEIFTYTPDMIGALKKQLAALQQVEVPKIIRDHLRDQYLTQKYELEEPAEEVLFKPLNVKILFAIRADRLGMFSAFVDYFPNLLRWTYELDSRLTPTQARTMLTGPAALSGPEFESTPFRFQPETLDKLINLLSSDNGEIDPVQLQIVASYVEQEVIKTGVKDVQPEMLGDITGILFNYYEWQLAQLPIEQRYEARRVLEEGLIIKNNRTFVSEDSLADQFRVSPMLLDQLKHTNLIRKTTNALGTYYEISHDSLLPGILQAKEKRLVAEKEEKVRHELEEKEIQLARAKRRTRILVSLTLLAMLMTFLALFLYRKAQKASDSTEQARQEAEKQRQEAMLQKNVAEYARMLADSSAALAADKTAEAEQARWQALESLRLAKREETRARAAEREALTLRDMARISADRANQATRMAQEQRDTASSALRNLSQKSDSLIDAQKELTRSIENQISSLKFNIARSIHNLEYESAYVSCIQLLSFDSTSAEARRLAQELAYVFALISSRPDDPRAFLLLRKIGTFPYSMERFEQVDPVHFQTLKHRYLPEMVQVSKTLQVAKTEITCWQYYVYAKSNARPMPYQVNISTIRRDTIINGIYYVEGVPIPTWDMTGDMPVVNISWEDAIDYSNWLTRLEGSADIAYTVPKKDFLNPSEKLYREVAWWMKNSYDAEYKFKRESKGYRLPTEKEWKQWAGPLPAGNDGAVWCAQDKPRSAGLSNPNVFGLCDMYGNMMEWCWKGDDTTYKPRKVTKGVVPQILQGGAWNDNCSELNIPVLRSSFEIFITCGFRVVRNSQK